MTSLRFSNLPLAEVTIRIVPLEESPVSLSLKGLAELWGRLNRQDGASGTFDGLVRAQREVPPGRPSTLSFELGPAPVPAALVDHERGLIVHVQPDLLAVKWAAESGRQYPGFSVLLGALETCVEAIAALIPEAIARPQYDVSNMQYANFVLAEPSASGILDRYFGPSIRPTRVPADAQFHGVNLSWKENGHDLRLIVERAEAAVQSEPRLGFLVTTAAGCPHEPSQFPSAEITRLHDQLQELFLGIISDHAKEEWGYAGSR